MSVIPLWILMTFVSKEVLLEAGSFIMIFLSMHPFPVMVRFFVLVLYTHRACLPHFPENVLAFAVVDCIVTGTKNNIKSVILSI